MHVLCNPIPSHVGSWRGWARGALLVSEVNLGFTVQEEVWVKSFASSTELLGPLNLESFPKSRKLFP